MGLSSVATIALQGLREQAQRLEAAAGNVASLDSGERTPHGVDAVAAGEDADLAVEMLELTESELNYRANAAVFETGADLWDILGMVTRD